MSLDRGMIQPTEGRATTASYEITLAIFSGETNGKLYLTASSGNAAGGITLWKCISCALWKQFDSSCKDDLGGDIC